MLSWGVFRRMPMRNPGFLGLIGAIHTLLLLALDNSEQRVLTLPVFIMVAVIFGLAMFFAAGLTTGRVKVRHYVLGTSHALAQVALGAGGLILWRELPFDRWDWPWPLVTAVAFYGPVAAVLSAEIVALYLLVAALFRINLNELFAGQGIEGFKGFVRMHIAADGSLTLYTVGVDRISRRWRPNPNAAPWAPWIVPRRPLRPKIVDGPVTIYAKVRATARVPDQA
jgi:hypothetical protein